MSEPDVTEDALLGGRVRLRQPRRGYRAAIDPLFLAAAAPAGPDDRVLDAGMGAGAASLCLAARAPGCHVTGLELQPELAALARENVVLNGLQDRIAVVEGDLLRPPDLAGGFDVIIANPPYLAAGGGTASPRAGKALADMEGEAGLGDWIAFCARMARHKGHVVLIHRADRLDGVLAALKQHGCGSVVLFPLWPRAGQAARRVIVGARKGGRAPLVLAPGLVLHAADGRYTAAAERVLRDGAALPLRGIGGGIGDWGR